jgi:D-apionate oxidoisomerase
MRTLTLIGAGGKMGCRITNNVKNSDWRVQYVETSPAGVQRLRDCGVNCSDAADALPSADVVIFAVPDVAMEAVTNNAIETGRARDAARPCRATRREDRPSR